MNFQKVYHKNDDITIEYNDIPTINTYYNRGYVFTRVSKGNMIQTRSLRIDLSKFELNSENRRILNKNENLAFRIRSLPLEDYSWDIHAMGKDFYSKRFGDGIMSASKIKEMFQDMDKSNMNSAFDFRYQINGLNDSPRSYIEHIFGANLENEVEKIVNKDGVIVGYCLCYQNDEIIHYAYPFYDLDIPKENSLGIGMMTKAIKWAKENGKKYIYLGSVVEPSSKYKLQFKGAEWFDEGSDSWNSDLEALKKLLVEKS